VEGATGIAGRVYAARSFEGVKQLTEPLSATIEHARSPRPTVLVVDDDPRNRGLLRAYLGHVYDVREAGDAAAGMKALEDGHIDLVLLDVMMPGTSGYECCKRMKARQGDAFLPVLLLTALGEQEDRNTGLESGADDFLTKPVERRELLLRVGAFLRLRDQQTVIRGQIEELTELASLKDDLVSLIVHDLRNPLASIFGILHLVAEDIADPTLKADLELAQQSAVRLRDTLDDLLNVRLLEERRLPVDRQPVAVQMVVDEAVASLAGAALDRGVKINIIGGAPLLVPMDRKLVRRSIENLLVNAIKYSPPDTAVDVEWSRGPEGMTLSIADRGNGIPKPLRERLFQKFASVLAHKGSGERRGFGLGLYQVRLVADAHGGSVQAGDREGGGTTFSIVLPLGAGT
jgi:two-component system sensor histidine kinase/response regulator